MLIPQLYFSYMELGLVVTRIHQALEFPGKELFNFITDEVSTARKEAEQNADSRVAQAKGQVAKLIGNSCYGEPIIVYYLLADNIVIISSVILLEYVFCILLVTPFQESA